MRCSFPVSLTPPGLPMAPWLPIQARPRGPGRHLDWGLVEAADGDCCRRDTFADHLSAGGPNPTHPMRPAAAPGNGPLGVPLSDPSLFRLAFLGFALLRPPSPPSVAAAGRRLLRFQAVSHPRRWARLMAARCNSTSAQPPPQSHFLLVACAFVISKHKARRTVWLQRTYVHGLVTARAIE